MPDRWAQFNRRINNEFEELKKRMTITIYGSYKPSAEKDLLIEMKEHLIKNHYLQTKIVEDYQSENEDSLEISKKCLQYSDVNFLIFTRTGKRFGVVRELAFISDSHLMVHKTPFCVVFDMLQDSKGSIPPLSLSDIRNSGIIRQEFFNNMELKKFLLAKSFWYVRKLRHELSIRQDN